MNERNEAVNAVATPEQKRAQALSILEDALALARKSKPAAGQPARQLTMEERLAELEARDNREPEAKFQKLFNHLYFTLIREYAESRFPAVTGDDAVDEVRWAKQKRSINVKNCEVEFHKVGDLAKDWKSARAACPTEEIFEAFRELLKWDRYFGPEQP